MNKAVHQHWVPRFYLNYFATPETRTTKTPRAWIFSKNFNDGDEKLTAVTRICGKKYLYSPVEIDGNRKWDLEEQLGNLEGTLGKIWPKLAEGYISLENNDLRKSLSLFIAIMHLRNPGMRKAIESIHCQLVEMYDSATFAPDGTPAIKVMEINGQVHESMLTIEDWKDYRLWGKNEHDRLFKQTIKSEAIYFAKILSLKRWSIVYTEADTFITSDRPVIVQHQSHQKFGIGSKGAIIFFPLSPKRLLVMDDMHSEPANQYYPIRESSAGTYNLFIWQSANQFMISGRPIQDVLNELPADEGNKPERDQIKNLKTV